MTSCWRRRRSPRWRTMHRPSFDNDTARRAHLHRCRFRHAFASRPIRLPLGGRSLAPLCDHRASLRGHRDRSDGVGRSGLATLMCPCAGSMPERLVHAVAAFVGNFTRRAAHPKASAA
jgi:hypothetical protein